ncbi:VanZ family protein [Listeria booriae]|uniref:VanZ family protein n=1 Tax=Listeria booriae TaxID=1552123 RepID=UPI0028802F62|nr:VanZ family protein [Listeria booriae]MDT0110763.1 VanZ family protein [Listeria booriae]
MIVIDPSGVALVLLYMIMLVVLFIISKIRKKRVISIDFFIQASFILYLMMLAKYTLLPIRLFADADISAATYFQLTPLTSILFYLQNLDVPVYGIQLFGNLILLLPFAIYLNIKKQRSLMFNIITPIIISLSIETLQLLIDFITQFPNKIFDVDDLLLNVAGFLIGALLSKYARAIIGSLKLRLQ